MYGEKNDAVWDEYFQKLKVVLAQAKVFSPAMHDFLMQVNRVLLDIDGRLLQIAVVRQHESGVFEGRLGALETLVKERESGDRTEAMDGDDGRR